MHPFLHRTSSTVMKMSGVHYSGNSEGRTLWPGKMNVCATILDSENMNLATPNVPNKAKSMVGAGCCLTGRRRGYPQRAQHYRAGMDLQGEKRPPKLCQQNMANVLGRRRGRPASEQFKRGGEAKFSRTRPCSQGTTLASGPSH
jgi:hypothetical protein